VAQTKIEWTDSTWSPVTGCTKVSAGCTNCYAERMAMRLAGRAGYPAENPFAVTLHPDRLNEPLRWRKPRRVFVCSMSDLFHKDVPFEFVRRAWAMMLAAPHHTYQVLTKRPERMAEFFQWNDEPGQPWCVEPSREHIWLGTSVENQATADERIPHLLRCPAAVRFVSYEPALGAVDFRPGNWLPPLGGGPKANMFRPWENPGPPLDWIIAGGESGPHARPAHPDWFRSVRDQCAAAGVPFFFKQWGEWRPPLRGEEFNTGYGLAGKPPAYLVSPADGGVSCFFPPNDPAVRRPDESPLRPMIRRGKRAAGHLLDGREHREWPKGDDHEA
jgi:protein gp37